MMTFWAKGKSIILTTLALFGKLLEKLVLLIFQHLWPIL